MCFIMLLSCCGCFGYLLRGCWALRRRSCFSALLSCLRFVIFFLLPRLFVCYFLLVSCPLFCAALLLSFSLFVRCFLYVAWSCVLVSLLFFFLLSLLLRGGRHSTEKKTTKVCITMINPCLIYSFAYSSVLLPLPAYRFQFIRLSLLPSSFAPTLFPYFIITLFIFATCPSLPAAVPCSYRTFTHILRSWCYHINSFVPFPHALLTTTLLLVEEPRPSLPVPTLLFSTASLSLSPLHLSLSTLAVYHYRTSAPLCSHLRLSRTLRIPCLSCVSPRIPICRSRATSVPSRTTSRLLLLTHTLALLECPARHSLSRVTPPLPPRRSTYRSHE